MARPQKLTLDFFLHDKNARRDRKVRALRKKHGNDGYAAFFCLLEMICDEDGLQLNLSNSVDLEIAVEDCGLRDDAHFYKIIHTCVDIGLFDRQLWESDRIVFSPALYRRYLDRLEERKQAAIRKKRSRDAKVLQSRISDAESKIVTRDNPVTTQLSREGHGVVTPQNYRTTELQNSELENLEEHSSSLSAAPRSDVQCESGNDQKNERSANAVKREWLNTVFLPNYPARLNLKTGSKTRAMGAVKKNMDGCIKILRLQDIESGAATQGLRCFIQTKLNEYRAEFGQDPPKMFPKDGNPQGVWALPYVIDPIKYIKDRKYLDEVEEDSTGLVEQTDLENTLKAIGVELERLKISAILPDEWQERTGVSLVKELPISEAIAYLSHLKNLKVLGHDSAA